MNPAEIVRRFDADKAGAASEAGTVVAAIARPQKHDTAGNLGCARRDQARRNQVDAAVAGRWFGATRRHEKIRALHSGMSRKTSSESFSEIFSKGVGNGFVRKGQE